MKIKEPELPLGLEDIGPQILESVAAIDPLVSTKGGNNKTAKKAVEILVGKGTGFKSPTATQRQLLAVEFAKKGYVIYGKAFDVVKVPTTVDLDDPVSIAKHFKQITLFEVKSTNRQLNKDFKGYFFSMSTAELLVAQSLKSQYKFAFVNTLTEQYKEMSLVEIYHSAQAIYPTWSIRF